MKETVGKQPTVGAFGFYCSRAYSYMYASAPGSSELYIVLLFFPNIVALPLLQATI
jgi:hypothetical protein